MDEIFIKRAVSFPDRLRLDRYRNAPSFGPRVLFFSGGTALKEISRTLKSYTHNSIHLVTPFDAGGSSRILRDALDMPAVGDIRARLLALADEGVLGHPEICELLAYRLPVEASEDELKAELARILDGTHHLAQPIARSVLEIITEHLAVVTEKEANNFDLRGASVGNLFLAGGYINHGRQLDPITFLLSKLVGAHGAVRPIVEEALHLCARLQNGEVIIGQDLITSKERDGVRSPIEDLFLSSSDSEPLAVNPDVSSYSVELISKADLICYPPGSFYSSVIANLLPRGVGKAIAGRAVPKVFIPSLGVDSEAASLSVLERVEVLLRYLRKDAGSDCATERLLTTVLLDESAPQVECEAIQEFGVSCTRLPLSSQSDPLHYAPSAFTEAILSLT